MKHFTEKHRVILLFISAFAALMVLVALANVLISRNPAVVASLDSIVQSYGLAGGFVVSFVGSLWFLLFPYEIILAPILKLYQPAILAIVLFAIGATLADTVNFFSGRYLGEGVIRKKVSEKKLVRIEKFLEKWGIFTLLLFGFIGPVTSYDILALVMGGFSKMRFRLFLGITIVARIIHFTVVFFIADVLLGMAGIA